MLIDGRSFLGVSDQTRWCLLTNNLLGIGAYSSLHSMVTSVDSALPTVLLCLHII